MTANKFVPDKQTQDFKGISFVHHKGGTGKTTSCLSVAGWLTRMKKKVLVVDLDPQGNATCGLGIDRNTTNASMYDALFGRKNIQDIIVETNSGVYLAPSSLDLLAAETHLAGKVNNMRILRERLSDIQSYFDYVLIDVPPGSTLLMMMGIAAFENIIVPLDAGVFAYEALSTLKSLVIELDNKVGVETNLLMMLLREPSDSVLDKYQTWEMKKLLREFLSENNMPQVKIFSIPFSREIYRAQMKGLPISHYASLSGVGMAYRRIAKEIVIRPAS
mgnify:FL=1